MESIVHIMMQLPEDYEDECYKQGAIIRKRGVSCPATLMLLAIYHLHNGCSLKEMSQICRLTEQVQMSDVAFLKRFEQCKKWFMTINNELMQEKIADYSKPSWLANRTVIAVDASDVSEKGRSGRIYRLHYALDIFHMCSYQYKITTAATGESLCNFTFQKDQLVMADRGYARIKDIMHCEAQHAEYLIRMRKNSFTIRDENGDIVDLSSLLAELKADECLDLHAYATNSGKDRLPIRICAQRKSPEAIEQTRKKLHRKESKQQCEISKETQMFNQYIVMVTNIDDSVSAEEVLNTYRLRWQIEIYFKRLKSIMDFGELPKRREESILAWLNGKIMIALLIEKFISKATFPPNEYSEQEYLA